MLKIAGKSVKDAGGSKTLLCAKDHARTPSGVRSLVTER